MDICNPLRIDKIQHVQITANTFAGRRIVKMKHLDHGTHSTIKDKNPVPHARQNLSPCYPSGFQTITI